MATNGKKQYASCGNLGAPVNSSPRSEKQHEKKRLSFVTLFLCSILAQIIFLLAHHLKVLGWPGIRL